MIAVKRVFLRGGGGDKILFVLKRQKKSLSHKVDKVLLLSLQDNSFTVFTTYGKEKEIIVPVHHKVFQNGKYCACW